jgi:hypothetical protein
MIAGEGSQEAKEHTAGGGVDDLIYPWEWIRILGTGFVETCEVHAEALIRGVPIFSASDGDDDDGR